MVSNFFLCAYTGLGKVCPTQGISEEHFSAIQILHIDVIGQGTYQHALEALGGSIKGFLRDALLWLVVRVDGYVTTIGVLVPLLENKNNSEHLLLDCCISCFCVAEGSAGVC